MPACFFPLAHRPHWRVSERDTGFQNGRRVPAVSSEVLCLACGHRWRTRARYLRHLADITTAEFYAYCGEFPDA
jgi:hypothetical protein